ncbi:VG15 protein [Kribbella sp. CA-293567]|uniref:VG15 protein n=1 Tax=Kribbella sp. CA-293567 TaxID=3002436 RepID=UPI0022DE7A19|nr:hypothetical protein [Kribbella sp. CA-293567]WBQ03780.1 hypothetical protein OX958_27900 [Kribbella sp. CA-293567]
MATLAEAAALTDAYRIGQGTIAARAAALAVIAFRALLNPSDLDNSFPALVAAMHPILGGARSDASVLAGAYYEAHRLASGVEGQEPTIVAPDPLTLAQTASSLLFSGPVSIRQQLAKGNDMKFALTFAEGITSRSVFRHAANAGRGTIFNTAQSDRLALGYARVTDGSPCSFCAMLASRGADYKTASAAGAKQAKSRKKDGRPVGAKFHDGCGCSIVAIYSEDDTVPGPGEEYAALWADSTKGVPTADKANAFRRALDAQRR